jgi:putative nucleotidyltransferase with HDIG domain
LWLAIDLIYYAMHKFAQGNNRKYNPDSRELLFLVMVFIASFVLAKVGIFISTAMQSAFPYIDSGCYYYALPFAAAAMLVRIVLNSETAMVFSVLFALLTGLLFADNLFVALYVLIGSLVAAHSVKYCMSRSSLFRAGLILSVANMVTVTAIFAVEGHHFDTQFLYATGFAFCGGFICALLVNGTIPLAEAVFKYTTDFKLMELANMNTPILRELMIQAPGTYHHSIMVGLLVENAAESIGANPLLARVAAYYHDIGKVKKPLYFSENIKNQENRHDKLAPSMSALILTSHVKDGAELARESKLGNVLIEIIRQHHGTSLIKFFYEKAQQQAKDEMVNEQDYRYPGPKPQSREAALIMLADSVEAAGRTLANPTSARIQGMVQKIINNIFIDGQLNECDLTLMDLHKIAKSFNRILVGIFHQRIEYPEPAYKERIKEDKKTTSGESKGKSSGDINRESTAETSGKPGEVTADIAEDLKRLGMS